MQHSLRKLLSLSSGEADQNHLVAVVASERAPGRLQLWLPDLVEVSAFAAAISPPVEPAPDTCDEGMAADGGRLDPVT